MKPILVVGAMSSEINYVIQKLENCKESKLSNYKFYEGTINGYPVNLIKTEVGLINAASSTTLAIEKCDPCCIINEGTAGGITPNHHKKDIIIGEEIFNIMAAKTPYKELGEGSNSLNWNMVSFIEGEDDRRIVLKADEKLMDFIYNLKDEYKNGNVYKGVIGSADVWNREKDKLKYLNDKFNVSCEDMESIAVYTVAKNYNIPAVSIKIMSDNELLGEEYEPAVGMYLQEYCYKILVELTNKLKEE